MFLQNVSCWDQSVVRCIRSKDLKYQMVERIPNIMPYSYVTEQFGQHGNASNDIVREIDWDINYISWIICLQLRFSSVPKCQGHTTNYDTTTSFASFSLQYLPTTLPFELRSKISEKPFNDKERISAPIFCYAVNKYVAKYLYL